MFPAQDVSLVSANQKSDSGGLDQSELRDRNSGFNKGKCHTYTEDQIILLHILQGSDHRDTEPTWENIFVTPFKYFLYRRKIFPMILKLFQYPQAETIYQLCLYIYLCWVYDPAVECFVTELPALDYNLIKS